MYPQGQAGSVYGRQMYEVMRYWDDDHPEWDAQEHAFATVTSLKRITIDARPLTRPERSAATRC